MKNSSSDIHVILDMDGVILDYVSGFFAWISEHHNLSPSVMPHEINRFSLLEYFEKGKLDGRIYRDFSQHSDFSSIPLYTGAAEFMQELEKSGVSIHAVTSCGDEVARQLREKNLIEKLGWTHPLHVLPLSADKREVLSSFPKRNSIFVDDLYKNILSGKDTGIETIWYKPYETMLYTDCGEHELGMRPVVGYPALLKSINDFCVERNVKITSSRDISF